MKIKKLLFFVIIVIFIVLINTSCFAINVTVDGSTIQLPDFVRYPSSENTGYYFIFQQANNSRFYLYSLDEPGGLAYYQEADNRIQIKNFNIYHYNLNSDTQWVYETGLGGPINLYLSSNTLLYSNFDILYENSDRVYFADSTKEPEPEPEINGGIDKLYIGDIPTEFCFAQFTTDYVTLYNKSSANNEELPYYRIYFVENGFYYDTGITTFDTTVNFQKINVTNNFFYRRDFVNICLTTFIIVIFFLWVTNLFTSIIYKGGVLRGLF